MDPFERGLQQDIPLGEAASFFLQVKHGNAGPGARQAEALRQKLSEAAPQNFHTVGLDDKMRARLHTHLKGVDKRLKEKDSEGMGELPATGMGKNMPAVPMPQMPSAAMGQHKIGAAKGPSRAQERAHEALEVKFEKHHHTKNERRMGNAASAAGSLAGGFAGHALGKHPTTAAAGALVGYGVGKALGRDIGAGEDARRFAKHGSVKTALIDTGIAAILGAQKAEAGGHNKWEGAARGGGGYAGGALIGEALGHAAGRALGNRTYVPQALGHFAGGYTGYKALTAAHDKKKDKKDKKKSAHALFKLALEEQGMAPASTGEDGEMPIEQYLAAQQEGLAAEGDNQAAYLRQKLQEAQAQLQQTQQESQMAQTSAQQAQAQQATHEQQMQAVQQQSQMATEAAMQNVNQAHELALKATSQALQAKDDAINTHQMAAQMRMAYQDMRGTIMDTVAQDNAAPIGEAIKAKGMESQVMPPGGEVPGVGEVGPDGQPAEEGPAEETADPNAPPGSPPPTGAEHGAQANGDGAPGGPEEPEPAGQAGIKAAGVVGDLAGRAGKFLQSRAPHMAVGAGIGASLPYLESRIGNDGLRSKVKSLQDQHDQNGGFGTALMLAQSKMRLAASEVFEHHPGASSIVGGFGGAIGGAIKGPDIYQTAMKLPGKIRGLGASE